MTEETYQKATNLMEAIARNRELMRKILKLHPNFEQESEVKEVLEACHGMITQRIEELKNQLRSL
ncbi:hypothetical protein [Paludibacter sp.]|uniref:hypothetical protein n=1 Tax=Paludibacter sp. TaxID=1898105 RepID=UPI001353DE0E|nr:hypothetical protein [Paludibacter sp.]MTK53312.1 hypothetical protein [Paludibacter sp.]